MSSSKENSLKEFLESLSDGKDYNEDATKDTIWDSVCFFFQTMFSKKKNCRHTKWDEQSELLSYGNMKSIQLIDSIEVFSLLFIVVATCKNEVLTFFILHKWNIVIYMYIVQLMRSLFV